MALGAPHTKVETRERVSPVCRSGSRLLLTRILMRIARRFRPPMALVAAILGSSLLATVLLLAPTGGYLPRELQAATPPVPEPVGTPPGAPVPPQVVCDASRPAVARSEPSLAVVLQRAWTNRFRGTEAFWLEVTDFGFPDSNFRVVNESTGQVIDWWSAWNDHQIGAETTWVLLNMNSFFKDRWRVDYRCHPPTPSTPPAPSPTSPASNQPGFTPTPTPGGDPNNRTSFYLCKGLDGAGPCLTASAGSSSGNIGDYCANVRSLVIGADAMVRLWTAPGIGQGTPSVYDGPGKVINLDAVGQRTCAYESQAHSSGFMLCSGRDGQGQCSRFDVPSQSNNIGALCESVQSLVINADAMIRLWTNPGIGQGTPSVYDGPGKVINLDAVGQKTCAYQAELHAAPPPPQPEPSATPSSTPVAPPPSFSVSMPVTGFSAPSGNVVSINARVITSSPVAVSVTLTASGMPAGMTVASNPNPAVATASSPACTLVAVSSPAPPAPTSPNCPVITFYISASTLPGVYPIVLMTSSGGVTRTNTVKVTVK